MKLGKGVPGHTHILEVLENTKMAKLCPRISLKNSRDVYHYQIVPSPSSNLVDSIFQTFLLNVRFLA